MLKGIVKRHLKEVGFVVETLSGPPGKREMIRKKINDKLFFIKYRFHSQSKSLIRQKKTIGINIKPIIRIV